MGSTTADSAAAGRALSPTLEGVANAQPAVVDGDVELPLGDEEESGGAAGPATMMPWNWAGRVPITPQTAGDGKFLVVEAAMGCRGVLTDPSFLTSDAPELWQATWTRCYACAMANGGRGVPCERQPDRPRCKRCQSRSNPCDQDMCGEYLLCSAVGAVGASLTCRGDFFCFGRGQLP